MKKEQILRTVKKQYRKKWKYVLVLLPILFWFVYLRIYPNLQVFPLSLYDWSPLKTSKEYVGFENFYILFTVKKAEFMPRVMNTILYVVFLLVIQTALGLILTLSLRKNTRRNSFFRAYFFLPMVFSSTMVSLTWSFMYDPNLGVLNTILGKLGVEGYPGHNFLLNSTTAILCVVLVHIWANIGYPMMMLLSGLTSISDDVLEAAKIDGANKWQTFWSIEFPMLLPTLLRMMLLTITTGSMSVDYIYMIGGTFGTTFDTWSSWMYRQTLGGTSYGMVSAAGVVLFFILATVSVIQYVAMNKVEKKMFG